MRRIAVEPIIATVAAYVAIAVPVTVAVANLGKLVLQWLIQRHTIRTTNVQQNHQIINQYLDKALDPQVPLAIRHQLLRFLSTPETKGDRLQNWATAELVRIGSIIDETNRAVSQAEADLNAAKTPSQVQDAERRLLDAVKNQRSLIEAPKSPAITPAALKAELIPDKKLDGLVMKDADLQGTRLLYRDLKGADFSGSDLRDANFQGSDLRSAVFSHCTLSKVQFYEADLRGADLTETDLTGAHFQKARLEGATFIGATLKNLDLRATYDEKTKWPPTFQPDKMGAVFVGDASVPKTKRKPRRKDG
jgi:uncharacterized protein YjbI with pentapeptide repeats